MKEYICECCNKKWSDKTHYNTHLNSKKITGEPRKKHKTRVHKKPLVKWHCDLCNKDFGCKNNFRKHCLVRFETHAVYANQNLGLGIYKNGYTADGVKIEDIPEQNDYSEDELIQLKADLNMMNYVNFSSDNFAQELNDYIDMAY